MMYSCLRRASCWPPFELAHLVIKCIIPSEPCLDKLIYNPGTLDIAEKCKMCPTHIFLTWSKTFNDLIKVLSFGRQISRHFLDWFKKRSLDLNLLMEQHYIERAFYLVLTQNVSHFLLVHGTQHLPLVGWCLQVYHPWSKLATWHHSIKLGSVYDKKIFGSEIYFGTP